MQSHEINQLLSTILEKDKRIAELEVEVAFLKTDVKVDYEKIQKDAYHYLNVFASKMRDLASEIIGEVEVNTLPHIETDAWINYRQFLKLELENEYRYSKFKEPWAANFRKAVFVENRKEMAELISKDILNRIKHLEDCRQEYDQFRYSPGGDRYQDIVKERDQLQNLCREMRDALIKAKSVVKDWHGKDSFEFYANHAPEMKPIRDAVLKADAILEPKNE